jgi:hypothetical protein
MREWWEAWWGAVVVTVLVTAFIALAATTGYEEKRSACEITWKYARTARDSMYAELKCERWAPDAKDKRGG